jgi:hypothetical protein
MSKPPAIHADLLALFEFTRARVMDEDIERNVPNDPGVFGYIKLWTGIRLTGGIPHNFHVDLEEVINLTRWGKRTSKSFLAFRRFTSAVGLVAISWGAGQEYGTNYLAHNLLTDLLPGDAQHLDLVRRAIAVVGQHLKQQRGWIWCQEYPFFTLGELILAEWAGDHAEARAHAARLLLEEEAVWMDPDATLPGRSDGRFLFCITYQDQFEAAWTELVAKLENPENDPHIARVKYLFAGGER